MFACKDVSRDMKVRMICRKCGTRSQWLSAEKVDFCHNVGNNMAFWHDYPLNPHALTIFADQKAEADDAPKRGSKKHKGNDKTHKGNDKKRSRMD
jgi:hypothetical protein